MLSEWPHNRIDFWSQSARDLQLNPQEILTERNKILEIIENEQLPAKEKWSIRTIDEWKKSIIWTIDEDDRLELEELEDVLLYLDFLEATAASIACELDFSRDELNSCKDISAWEQHRNNFYMYFMESNMKKVPEEKKAAFNTFFERYPELVWEITYYVRMLNTLKPVLDYYIFLYTGLRDDEATEFFKEKTQVTILREIIWVELNELLKLAAPKLLALWFTDEELFT